MNIKEALNPYLKAKVLEEGDIIAIVEDTTISLTDISFRVAVARGDQLIGEYKYSPNITMLNKMVAEAGTFSTNDFIGQRIRVKAFIQHTTGLGWVGDVIHETKQKSVLETAIPE